MSPMTAEIALVDDARLSLRRRPYEAAREEWARLVAASRDATLSHGERWLAALERTYRLRFEILALVDERTDETLAAGIFAPSRSLFGRRFVSLPFSDACPPLAASPGYRDLWARELSRSDVYPRAEIRGYGAAPPWQVATTFVEWKLRIDRNAQELRRAMDGNFRRQLRRGEESGFDVRCGNSADDVRAFYELMLLTRQRFGLPAQPLSFFQNLVEIFGRDSEVWLVAKNGRDLAAMFLLRERDTIHYRWSARVQPLPLGASHVMIWRVLEHHSGRAYDLNLGRNDYRNSGISRFKTELGATSTPLPYSFFPRSPQAVSAERLEGFRALLARVWQRTPLPVARRLGPRLYKFLS